jgi:hypothetical protein
MDVKNKKIFGLIFITSILLMIFTFLSNSLPTRNSVGETATPSPTLEPSFEAGAGTSCNLIFIPASGDMLSMDATANENGECVWRWKLEESYKKGTARLIFTINEMSQTHFLQILENF